MALGVAAANGDELSEIARVVAKDKNQTDTAGAEIDAIARKDRKQQEDIERSLNTPVFSLILSGEKSARSTALLDEWRQRGTVMGCDPNHAPGPQIPLPLPTSATVRLVGAYEYLGAGDPQNPAAYLHPGGFDKIVVLCEAQWPRQWYEDLLRDVPDNSVLVGFRNSLGQPDFDGIKEFMDAFGPKVWALAPGWGKMSNLLVWDAPPLSGLMKVPVTVDPGYRETAKHLWAVTNFVNASWPDKPVVVYMCENRYTNDSFAKALGFVPSAFLLHNERDYEWGTGKMAPDQYATSQFRLSGMQAIRQLSPTVPVLCHGQRARLGKVKAGEAEAEKAFTREADSFFKDAGLYGYAGACLSIVK